MRPPAETARLRRRVVLAACVILWTTALVATHIPPARVPRLGVADRLLHVAGFFALATVFWLTLVLYEFRRVRRDAIVVLAMLAYAAIDESTQPLVGRAASVLDWGADALGACLAVIVSELLALALPQKQRPSAADAG